MYRSSSNLLRGAPNAGGIFTSQPLVSEWCSGGDGQVDQPPGVVVASNSARLAPVRHAHRRRNSGRSASRRSAAVSAVVVAGWTDKPVTRRRPGLRARRRRTRRPADRRPPPRARRSRTSPSGSAGRTRRSSRKSSRRRGRCCEPVHRRHLRMAGDLGARDDRRTRRPRRGRDRRQQDVAALADELAADEEDAHRPARLARRRAPGRRVDAGWDHVDQARHRRRSPPPGCRAPTSSTARGRRRGADAPVPAVLRPPQGPGRSGRCP